MGNRSDDSQVWYGETDDERTRNMTYRLLGIAEKVFFYIPNLVRRWLGSYRVLDAPEREKPNQLETETQTATTPNKCGIGASHTRLR